MTNTIDNHPDRQRWNERYLKEGLDKFGREPSPLLAEYTHLLESQPKGNALDLACGNGRNTFYLARLGFQVDALDISDVAIESVRKRGQESGLTVRARVANLETENLPQDHYQVVVNFNYLERKILPRIGPALAAGGLLFFQTFTRAYLEEYKPQMNPGFGLEPDELLKAFPDLEVVHYANDLEIRDDDRIKIVARLIARKASD